MREEKYKKKEREKKKEPQRRNKKKRSGGKGTSERKKIRGIRVTRQKTYKQKEKDGGRS